MSEAETAETEKTKRPSFATLCGRLFYDADPTYFPRAEYRGRTLYLCTESCLSAFLADPGPFCKAHRNSEKNKGPIHKKPEIVERG